MGTINRGKALGPKTLEGYALKGEKEKREREGEKRERVRLCRPIARLRMR